MASKNIAVISRECVACGNCLKACPSDAISIFKGKFAMIDSKKCLGCGICAKACPADVISMHKRCGE